MHLRPYSPERNDGKKEVVEQNPFSLGDTEYPVGSIPAASKDEGNHNTDCYDKRIPEVW